MDLATTAILATVSLSNPWVSVGFAVLAVVLGVLAVIVTKTNVLKGVEKKLGFDLPDSVEAMAEGFLVKGINWAENWAKKQSEKPTSDDKLAEAVRFAVNKAGNSEGLKNTLEEKGVELVEKLLRSDETPDEVTPKE